MLSAWLHNPIIQSSLIPLLASLISATILAALLRFYTPLSVIIGYALAFIAIMGIFGLALNTTTKLALWALGSSAVFVLLEQSKASARVMVTVAIANFILAIIYVFWGIFRNMQWMPLGLWLMLGWVYTLVIFYGLSQPKQDVIQATVAALVLALATGAMTMMAGSALLMQLNFALAAALGGLLAIYMLLPSGQTYILYTVPMVAALLMGCMAFNMALQEEDAWVLVPLAWVVLGVKWFPGQALSPWRQLLRSASLTLPGAFAVITWLYWTGEAALEY